mgnify:CR=1 FL=1
MDFKSEIEKIGKQSLKAARQLTAFSTAKKNNVLEAMADALAAAAEEIKEANKIDLEAGEKSGLNAAMLDRLCLDDERIDGMVKGLRDLAGLEDPVGKIDSSFHRPNGLIIEKIRVPIGVIGIIYESRPNVTVDAAGLCLKAGNPVILRGGSEAIHSNRKLAEIMQKAGVEAGLPEGAVTLIPWTEREAVTELIRLDKYIHLIIPRGGESLIRFVSQNATIPVIKHYKGVCHLYVDKDANLQDALAVADNAKRQRPGVCNAMETLLVHREVAKEFLTELEALFTDVELRGDEAVCKLVSSAIPATEEDWSAEYLELILAVKVVDSVDEAIDHINDYGSGHSDAIMTCDKQAQRDFKLRVDSSSVYVNASTRFTDGSVFGMGAEIGISTDRLHARGPMGLEELTTYKYVISGNGQTRD